MVKPYPAARLLYRGYFPNMSKPIQILVPNLGSTSLKFQVLAMPSEQVQAKGRLERVKNYREAVAGILA